MRQVAKERRLEALPARREPRRQKLAELARTDRKARAKLLAELYTLVERVAKKQGGQGVDHEDLAQAGMEGVLKAIQGYTPMKGATFTSYAYWWIHGEMRRSIAWQKRTIRVPEYRFLLAGKEVKARERLQHKLGARGYMETGGGDGTDRVRRCANGGRGGRGCHGTAAD